MDTRRGFAPIIIVLLIAAVVLAGGGGYLLIKNSKIKVQNEGQQSISQVFPTQEECEQATDKQCMFQMCDYVPPGKTFEEVCGKDFRKGWVPIITSSDSVPPGSVVRDVKSLCLSDSDCQSGFACDYSYALPKGWDPSQAKTEGDQLCHKRCETNVDCSEGSVCTEKELFAGDVGTRTKFCVSKTANTQGWKTYRNEQYGFEVRYPSNLMIFLSFTSSDPKSFSVLTISANESVLPVFRVSVHSEEMDFMVSRLKNSPHHRDVLVTDYSTDGLLGKKASYYYVCGSTGFPEDPYCLYDRFHRYSSIFYSKEGKTLELSSPQTEGNEYFLGILSTFKFISSTSLWQTDYRCGVLCTGREPSPNVVEDCRAQTTEQQCNTYKSEEFPYGCSWSRANSPCLAP